MSVHVRLFAGAADAVGEKELDIDVTSVGALFDALIERGGDDTERVLGVCSVLVNGVRAAGPSTIIAQGSNVDVLPPFAGG